MSLKPILFSDQMVRAIMDGKKFVTRRIVKRPKCLTDREFDQACEWMRDHDAVEVARRGPADGLTTVLKSPYGRLGDRLWVRERWQIVTGKAHGDLGAVVRYQDMALNSVQMPAEKPMSLGLTWDRWRPSIHMPRWSSRITLEVGRVSVERLHDITDEEAALEGIETRSLFKQLWCNLNGDESWDANPWVWRVQFRVLP